MKISLISLTILLVVGLSFASISAQDNRDQNKPFPIPEFGQIIFGGSAGERNNLAAEKLGSAMSQIKGHLCKKPDPVTNDWQAKFDKLLVEMVASEYGVVWTQLTNFNSVEQSIYDQFLVERQKIVRLLSDYTAKNPELKVTIDEYQKARTSLLLANKNEYGRAIFTIHAELFFDRTFPENVRISPKKMRDLGIVEEYTAIRSKMIVLIAQLHKRLNERGTAEINKLIPKNSMFPFAIHEVPGHLKQPFLERLMVELQNLGVRMGGKDAALPIYESDEWTTNAGVNAAPFGSSEQDVLRGDCKNGAKRWKSVRIVYRKSRVADAERAADLLRQNGFTVNQLWKIKTTEDGWTGVFCSNLSSSLNEAGEIAEIVKSIVQATPRTCPARGDEPTGVHYVLWVNDR